MHQENLSNALRKLSTLSERYGNIAQKELKDHTELETSQAEMRIIKETMLKTIIEAKQTLKKIEEKAKLQ